MPKIRIWNWGKLIDPEPVFGDTIHFYVDPAGSDLNVGTAEHPFLTLEKAQSCIPTFRIANYEIHLAAGTYAEQFELNSMGVGTITLRGPDVSGGMPTAILDGTGITNGVGVSAQDDKYLRLIDLKIQNYEAYQVRAHNKGRIYGSNVRVYPPSAGTAKEGFYCGNQSKMELYDCWNSGGTYGILALYSSTIHAENATVINCTSTGITVQKGSYFLLRGNSVVEANAIGVYAEDAYFMIDGYTGGHVEFNYNTTVAVQAARKGICNIHADTTFTGNTLDRSIVNGGQIVDAVTLFGKYKNYYSTVSGSMGTLAANISWSILSGYPLIAPRAGRIVAVSAKYSSNVTAGSITVAPAKNGIQQSSSLSAVLSTSNPSYNAVESSSLTFAKGGQIAIAYSTSADFAPTGGNLYGSLMLEFDGE